MLEKTSRRNFLKYSALAAAGVAAVACQPQTVVVKETVPVEKVVKETVVVEKEVTKVVEQTRVVEKLVTPTPSEVHEAPDLFVQVSEGNLPPLAERLPNDLLVLEPVEMVGEYGGTWRRCSLGMGDVGGNMPRTNMANPFFWNRTGTSVLPDVFNSVEVSEGGQVYTFGLRQGHRWSDGEPFTADDLMYLYDDVFGDTDLSPSGVGGWLKSGGEPVVIEKVDDYTVRFTYTAPYGLFMLFVAANGEGLLPPAHYMKQFHAKYVDQSELDKMVSDAGLDTWDQLYWNMDSWYQNADRPSLRPWRVVEPPRAGAQTFYLTRNAYYHKVDPNGNQLPYIDEQRFTFVETPDMLKLKAVAGEIDMQLRSLTLTDYPVLSENAEKGGYRLILWEILGTGAVVFPNHTLLKDEDVLALNGDIRWRKALSLLVDRDEINELIYLGKAGPIQGLFPESLAAQQELWAPFTYDPDQANSLLDELGLDKRDASGWRLLPNGKPLALTVEGFSQDTSVMDACELIIASMQQAGLNAALKGVTYDQWWDRVYTSEYQLLGYTMSNYGPLLEPTYPRDYTPVDHSTYWAPEWGNWYQTEGEAGTEPTGTPRELQKMFDGVKIEPDEAKRIELFTQIYVEYLKFLPSVISAGRPANPGVVNIKMHNVPDQCPQSWTLRTPALANPEQFFFES